eukprot:CAMPEP_0169472072 /NCGR_PEP_ID=MMETSP1042-20121227/24948_1 /TAXON_ID=464988 /ORGANISM="Hemiselmis andersenii, Strain CCMP1180" /LENGTH=107 /DNA_ID=CAMNT_0009585851 /DNA_START=243 /DNA_END=562 /DNA_ORIENTATION=-
MSGASTVSSTDLTPGWPTSSTSTSSASPQPAQGRKRQAQQTGDSTGCGMPCGGWQPRRRARASRTDDDESEVSPHRAYHTASPTTPQAQAWNQAPAPPRTQARIGGT